MITSTSAIEPITIDVYSKNDEGVVTTATIDEVFEQIVELFESESLSHLLSLQNFVFLFV